MKWLNRFAQSLLCLILLVGCNDIPLQNTPISKTIQPTTTIAVIPTAGVTPTTIGPRVIKIWLPPTFDPEADNPASKILKNQLEEFSSRRGDIHLDIRIKAMDGSAGLLESLESANAAAPLALPDLVLLNYPMLEVAASKGLLHPYDGLSQVMDDPDWYEHAKQVARVHNTTFGFPFASDALALLYRSSIIETPPKDIITALDNARVIAFPAADPQALLTLTFYLSAGGTLLDEQGKPSIDKEILTEVFKLIDEGQSNQVFPYWLTQYQTYEQSFQTYLDNRTELAITWVSDYLSNPLEDTSISVIPTYDGRPYVLADDWIWAIANPGSDYTELTIQLAEFLVDKNFMASWTEAMGYLPTRPGSLTLWQNKTLATPLNQIAASTHNPPSADILALLTPALSEATIQVMKNQLAPLDAVELVVSQIKNP
jgi:multiple sugar transport system substrate-binding protein